MVLSRAAATPAIAVPRQPSPSTAPSNAGLHGISCADAGDPGGRESERLTLGERSGCVTCTPSSTMPMTTPRPLGGGPGVEDVGAGRLGGTIPEMPLLRQQRVLGER